MIPNCCCLAEYLLLAPDPKNAEPPGPTLPLVDRVETLACLRLLSVRPVAALLDLDAACDWEGEEEGPSCFLVFGVMGVPIPEGTSRGSNIVSNQSNK